MGFERVPLIRITVNLASSAFCLPIYHVVVVGQVYPSYALSAVNRRPLGLNRLVLPVAPASECPDVLRAAFPSKARRVIPRPASFFLTKHALIGLSFNCFGMSPRQLSIPLEVATGDSGLFCCSASIRSDSKADNQGSKMFLGHELEGYPKPLCLPLTENVPKAIKKTGRKTAHEQDMDLNHSL